MGVLKGVMCILLAALASQACGDAHVEATSRAGDIRSRSLNDVQLRSLLIGSHVAPLREPNVTVSHPPGETFWVNGIYRRHTGRTSIDGTYEIVGDLICIEGDGITRRCRRVVARSDGTFIFGVVRFWTNGAKGRAMPVPY